MKSIEEINHLENCECDVICPNCTEKHKPHPEEKKNQLTGEQIADAVLKPNYYKAVIKGVELDVYDISEAYNLNIYKFNALKYILRAGKKDSLVQDLKKAIRCLERNIEKESCNLNIKWYLCRPMTEEQELISLQKEIEQLKQILKNREKRYEEIYNVFITNGSNFTTLLLQDQDCC